MWLVYKRLAEAVPELAGTDDGYDNDWALLAACICQADSAAASKAASEVASEVASEAASTASASLLQQRVASSPQQPSTEGAEGIASMHTPSRSF